LVPAAIVQLDETVVPFSIIPFVEFACLIFNSPVEGVNE
jgi:hypothetical protein